MSVSAPAQPLESKSPTQAHYDIEASELTKTYGRRHVLSGISFQVARGEILGLLGPNGAGKTTTMRILAGYTPANSGRVVIAGHDVARDSLGAREKLGYLPEHAPLYNEMTVAEYLDFMAELKRCRPEARKRAVREAIEECSLGEVSKRLIGNLSKGFRQRVGLAQAILGDPAVLILDEPTVGLDPRQIVGIRELIRTMAGRRTVLLSTHILPEVSMVCQRVIIIDRGRIVAGGTPEKLASNANRDSPIRVVVEGNPGEARELISRVPGVARVHQEHQIGSRRAEFRVQSSGPGDPRPEISRALIEGGFGLIEIGLLSGSLEEVFLQVISSAEGN